MKAISFFPFLKNFLKSCVGKKAQPLISESCQAPSCCAKSKKAERDLMREELEMLKAFLDREYDV